GALTLGGFAVSYAVVTTTAAPAGTGPSGVTMMTVPVGSRVWSVHASFGTSPWARSQPITVFRDWPWNAGTWTYGVPETVGATLWSVAGAERNAPTVAVMSPMAATTRVTTATATVCRRGLRPFPRPAPRPARPRTRFSVPSARV